jgi:hypothetical protein
VFWLFRQARIAAQARLVAARKAKEVSGLSGKFSASVTRQLSSALVCNVIESVVAVARAGKPGVARQLPPLSCAARKGRPKKAAPLNRPIGIPCVTRSGRRLRNSPARKCRAHRSAEPGPQWGCDRRGAQSPALIPCGAQASRCRVASPQAGPLLRRTRSPSDSPRRDPLPLLRYSAAQKGS